LSLSGGAVSIVDGKFENNNPFSPLYPSMRRNILCSSQTELNIASLKGGDGVKDNSSLWILPSSDCSLSGLPSERLSPFFIPSISEVRKEEVDDNYILTIEGSLFLPCNLSFSVLIDSESLTQNASNLIYTNESSFSCSVPLNTFNSHTSARIEVVLFFPRLAESVGTIQSPPFVVQNKSDENDDDGGNLSQSAPSSDPSNSVAPLWVAVGLLIALVIVLVVIVVMLLFKRKKERIIERVEKESVREEEGMRSDSGIELLRVGEEEKKTGESDDPIQMSETALIQRDFDNERGVEKEVGFVQSTPEQENGVVLQLSELEAGNENLVFEETAAKKVGKRKRRKKK
jgi:hypothetical protein